MPTRREQLMWGLMVDGVPWWQAREAIASVAIEHPEWDLDEEGDDNSEVNDP